MSHVLGEGCVGSTLGYVDHPVTVGLVQSLAGGIQAAQKTKVKST